MLPRSPAFRRPALGTLVCRRLGGCSVGFFCWPPAWRAHAGRMRMRAPSSPLKTGFGRLLPIRIWRRSPFSRRRPPITGRFTSNCSPRKKPTTPMARAYGLNRSASCCRRPGRGRAFWAAAAARRRFGLIKPPSFPTRCTSACSFELRRLLSPFAGSPVERLRGLTKCAASTLSQRACCGMGK